VSICKATKRNGESCTLPANGQQGLCWAHGPQERRAKTQGRVSRRQSEGQPGTVLYQDAPGGLTQQVVGSELQTGPAAAANQLINTRLRAIETERKIKATEELEARIETLERTQDRKSGRSWGA